MQEKEPGTFCQTLSACFCQTAFLLLHANANQPSQPRKELCCSSEKAKTDTNSFARPAIWLLLILQSLPFDSVLQLTLGSTLQLAPLLKLHCLWSSIMFNLNEPLITCGSCSVLHPISTSCLFLLHHFCKLQLCFEPGSLCQQLIYLCVAWQNATWTVAYCRSVFVANLNAAHQLFNIELAKKLNNLPLPPFWGFQTGSNNEEVFLCVYFSQSGKRPLAFGLPFIRMLSNIVEVKSGERIKFQSVLKGIKLAGWCWLSTNPKNLHMFPPHFYLHNKPMR